MISLARLLVEKLSFKQLYGVSEPKRIVRSLTVSGPPLEVDAYKNSMYYGFNFKAHPSTTGLRHKGYIKFSKPKRPTPLTDVPCEVDCDCPDYKYRWAWTNKQRGSGRVGPNSVNQAWNQAPVRTNPQGRSGLCKHILAIKDYIEGQTSDRDFIGNEPEGDGAVLLNKLVARSKKVWLNYDGTVAKAKSREKQLAKARMSRNKGEPLPPEDDEESGEGGPPPDGNMPPLPPVPSGGEGAEEEVPAEANEPTPVQDPRASTQASTPPERMISMRDLQKPRQRPATPTSPPRPPRIESVDSSDFMTDLEKAIKVVEELGEQVTSSGFENSVSGGECPEEEKSPGDQVLDLLGSIDQSLKTLAGGEEPELGPEDSFDAPPMDAPEGEPGIESEEEFDDVDKLQGV